MFDFSFRLTRPKPEAARELSSNRQDEAVPTCEGLQHLMPLNPKYMCGTPALHYPLASAEPRSAVQGVILTSSRLKRVEFKRQQAFLSSSSMTQWLNQFPNFQWPNAAPSHPRCPRYPSRLLDQQQQLLQLSKRLPKRCTVGAGDAHGLLHPWRGG